MVLGFVGPIKGMTYDNNMGSFCDFGQVWACHILATNDVKHYIGLLEPLHGKSPEETKNLD